MTKAELLKMTKDGKSQAEAFYNRSNVERHECETEHEIAEMNVNMFMDWLQSENPEPLEDWEALCKADRKEIWEASGFHFGLDSGDHGAIFMCSADHWWETEAYGD